MACPPQVWDGVLRRLAHELSPLALSAWITPLRADANGAGLRLSCPSAFHRERVRERFLARIEALASDEVGEPIPVTRGTKVRVTGWFDNSAKNPANPDPTRTVPFGEQTTDEMMIGYLDWVTDL